MNNPEHAPATLATTEHLPRPAPTREVPDWRRLETALIRHSDIVAGGIAYADEHHTGVDQETAQCIAHVLGRGLSPDSALAEYALTGNGDYEALRDEYLTIYHDPEAPAWVREVVDHFGTHLIYQTFPDASTGNYLAPYLRKLSRIYVPTQVTVDGLIATVYVPGIYGRETIAELPDTLSELKFAEDIGLQAFLSTPGFNAISGDIMEDYHNSFLGVWRDMESAVTELALLDDREEEVQDFAAERKLYFDYLTPDYEALKEELEESLSLVEREGRIYVFSK